VRGVSSSAAAAKRTGHAKESPPPEFPLLDEVRTNAELRLSGQPVMAISKAEKRVIVAALKDFSESSWTRDEALELYVNSELYPVVMARFRRLIRRGVTPELLAAMQQLGPGRELQQGLFGLFAAFVVREYKREITSYRELVKSCDLRLPHTWYTTARSMTRRIIYHAGPTNSGKTYNALQAMKGAASGVYCGPLRLLAMEVYDRLNADGLYCSLITGQEKQYVPGAEHMACTIEMVSMADPVDVAVIDEIQMIGDPFRGWAWTRAVQGVPAKEIHLCGDMSALPLIRQLVEDMGESLEVNTYDRFTELQIEDAPVEELGYSSVQPGDCIVAFSRRDIYTIKAQIEAQSPLKACVVYGALPPENRRHQAQLFNDPDSGYDVMVASDAVGMGLNLNIRRIIFHTLTKYDGTGDVPVSVSMIKQIAGRAGRRDSEWPNGYVACYRGVDLPALRAALAVPIEEMKTPHAGIFPEFEHLELFASQVPGLPFATLLKMMAEESRLDGKFFFCRQDPLVEVAKLIESVPSLSLKDRYHFCTAPIDYRQQEAKNYLVKYARQYSEAEICEFDLSLPNGPPATERELRSLEAMHQLAAMWLSLALRLKREDIFVGVQDAEKSAARIIDLMSDALRLIGERNSGAYSSNNGKPSHHHAGHSPAGRRSRTRRIRRV